MELHTDTRSIAGSARRGATLRKAPGRPLRILHVLNYFRRGGTELAVLKLIAGLERETFEHHLCATRKCDPEFVRSYGLENMVSMAGTNRAGLQFPLFRLRRIIKRFQPDIVHTRNWGAVEAIFAARSAGVPVVIHSEHGYEVENMGGLPLRQRLFRRQAYAIVDRIFTVTDQLRRFHAAQAWISPDRVEVLYNGVDTDLYVPSSDGNPRLRGELGIPSGRLVIGSVGRLEPIKDYPTLLRAAEQLIIRGQDVQVLLVGGGSQFGKLRNLVESSSHLRERVTFAGASDRVAELLPCIDVFVLSSLCEGMSNTILEAMACGLPVVVTRVGGNVEIVEEDQSGWFFKPQDVQGLTQKLGDLASNVSIRQTLGNAARARAIAHFSIKGMFDRYRSLYLESALRRGIVAPLNVSSVAVAGGRTG